MKLLTRRLAAIALVLVTTCSMLIPALAVAAPVRDAAVAPLAYTERVIDRRISTYYYETGQTVNTTTYKNLTFPTGYALDRIVGPTYEYGLTYKRTIYTYQYRIW